MSLQYISDDSGNHTAVIIPINEWNEITAKHEDIKTLLQESVVKSGPKKKPSEFAGILNKELAKQMIVDIEKDRGEWERRF
ncbi:hypothetical protein [Mucilaginibacter phyllosphaerae]|uniref:Prevent-host-death protein n=1 Tax=Mucilaginibacter phyllosphaerae TaxID=1812349 RepID=A0A4Y8AJF3_9SPHI|nr:hypothetical protein [Mucilaginibacter phyllosphaerae]MBB3967812.1 hypothetical protein [Mucilaginibacter phyllosphaerae]TEW69143.1 hypothetical protein E2R65_02960 [Mucilaginibacter phyllosphaerae]GGH03119.1 hypothetical protein GCM10007352_05710 [Mucilaginibacter phyllosphaerae]